MARQDDFDLAAALARRGFTPAQRDAPALVELIAVGDEPATTRARPALAGLGEVGRVAIDKRLAIGSTDDGGVDARLIAALGLFARGGDAVARASVIARLGDARPRVRRAAIVALGKLGTGETPATELDDVRAALVARWDAGEGDAPPEERRALAEALGKIGGDTALARLRGLDATGDGELARRRDRAVLMVERESKRDAASSIAVDVPPPVPLVVRLHCRPGLGGLLLDEVRTRAIAETKDSGEAFVDVELRGPWQALFASRLWASAGIRIALPATTPEAITAAVLAARPLLVAWTRGPIRWRLGFAHGHQRAVVWRVARDVTAAAPELINDPTATTWDILVDTGPARGKEPTGPGWLELVPRRAADPRFAWRVAEIPASSHPTVAAAIAWLGAARASDRVWDPFCGAGAELVERARLGPFAALAGGDLDPDALVAACANLDAADVPAKLARADSRRDGPDEVDLILTNPPLGSRVQLDAGALLVDALPNLAARLAPGGRLVWITPRPRRTQAAAEYASLTCTFHTSVDLGGVRGVLERWEHARRP